MLSSVRIENFKSYRDATLQFGPLTVLIGANASGKSNAIEALRLLNWISRGNRISALRFAGHDKELMMRGTVDKIIHSGENSFKLTSSITDNIWNTHSIELSVDDDKDLHIASEAITSPAKTVPLFESIFKSTGAGNDLRVAYNNFARGGKKPQISCSDQMTLLHQMQSAARFESGHNKAATTIPAICLSFQDSIGNILFLDPNPTLMRGYGFKSDQFIMGDGSNLSGVLHNIYAHQKDGILEFVQNLPEQSISDISFIETPRGETMLQLTETFGHNPQIFDATLLSDGTLRVLSVAAAVLSAERGSMVVIEEIDNGVHPSRARSLLSCIAKAAKKNALNVVLSSHNPAMLDSLPDDAIGDIVFCYRDLADGSSRLTRFKDLPDLPSLLAQGQIGHLMTHGVIEKFVKHHPGPEAKKRKAEEWLSRL